MFVWLIAAAWISAGASSEAAPATPRASSPSVSLPAKPVPPNALRLSVLANPGEKMIDLGMRGFQAGIDAELKKSPEEAAVYAANPGLLEAIRDAGQPVVRKHLEASIPARQQRFARFYADKLSAEEIDELIAFYSSPTGIKVIDAMYSGVNLDRLLEKMDPDKAVSVTAKDISELKGSVAGQLPEKFDADDWKAMFMFGATPVHAKLLKLAPEFNQLVADIENEPNPAMDAELDKAVAAAVQTYMARHKAKPGN